MIEVEQQGNVVIVHMREDVWRGDAGLRGAGRGCPGAGGGTMTAWRQRVS